MRSIRVLVVVGKTGIPSRPGAPRTVRPRSIAEGERGTRNCGECHQARKIAPSACDWALYSLLLPARSTPMFYAVPRIAWAILCCLSSSEAYAQYEIGQPPPTESLAASSLRHAHRPRRASPELDRQRTGEDALRRKVYGIGIRERHSVRVI